MLVTREDRVSEDDVTTKSTQLFIDEVQAAYVLLMYLPECVITEDLSFCTLVKIGILLPIYTRCHPN